MNIRIISSQNNPEVYPSIWISRSGGPPEFIFVRALRYPADHQLPLPSNWDQIGLASAQLAKRMAPELSTTRGYFVPIGIARHDEDFIQGRSKPLLRGYGMWGTFSNLSDYQSSVFRFPVAGHG
jgi:hypothetical protein